MHRYVVQRTYLNQDSQELEETHGGLTMFQPPSEAVLSE